MRQLFNVNSHKDLLIKYVISMDLAFNTHFFKVMLKLVIVKQTGTHNIRGLKMGSRYIPLNKNKILIFFFVKIVFLEE